MGYKYIEGMFRNAQIYVVELALQYYVVELAL